MALKKRKYALRGLADFLDGFPRRFKNISTRARIIAGAALVVAAVGIALLIIFSGNARTSQVASLDQPDPTYTAEPTPTPTPTPVPTTTPVVTEDPTLKKGDENEDVQQLQERLMDLGYLDIDDTTLLFGPATEHAVKLFQRQIDVDQTGVADAQTQAWLFSSDAKSYTLLQEMEGSDVSTLQRRLNELGYLADGKNTGYYGEVTVAAVKAFQKANHLTADGKTGEDTLNKIYSFDAVATPAKRKEYRAISNKNDVINAAEAKLGKPYVSGAEGPNQFDCSGLVYWCLHQAGSNIGRLNAQGYSAVSRWDIVCQGTLDFNKLEKGDLLFFYVPGRNKSIGHVAIYIGNKTIIDASSSNGKVVKRSCNSPWFKTNFRLARRPYGSA